MLGLGCEHAPASGKSASALNGVCAAGFAFLPDHTNHAPLISALPGDFHFSTFRGVQISGGPAVDRLGAQKLFIVAADACLRIVEP